MPPSTKTRPDRWTYAKLQESDFEGHSTQCLCGRKLFWERWIWLIWSIALISIILWQALLNDTYDSWSIDDQYSSYEMGFDTDLVAAVPSIRLKQIQFTGGIERHDNGTLYLNTSGVAYVGDPSDELDALWESYEAAVELHLDNADTKTKGGSVVHTMEDGDPNWHRLSIDVIHSLHCVNRLRKAVYADHYFPGDREEFWYTHMNHCIEHLRQAIECHSDLTPLAYTWDDDRGTGTPVWTQKHTCRDFDSILNWDNSRLAKPLFDSEHSSR